MVSPIRLRDDGDHLALTRTKGGGWASDDTEIICRLDRLQVANLVADAEQWLRQKRGEDILPGHASDHLDLPGRGAPFVVCECGRKFYGDGTEHGAWAVWRLHATGEPDPPCRCGHEDSDHGPRPGYANACNVPLVGSVPVELCACEAYRPDCDRLT